ncbi:MAG TPA: flagellar basal body rod protein FlgB [Syntrophorhabdaceae bacterium]|nr:flagellar basal body rod protein FlgB [Syntrophorhabdaceae bacterium]
MDMINLIEKALNIRTYYHRVISGNIANAETPAYKEKDIDFKKELARRIDSDQASFANSDFEVTENQENDGLSSIDGNTVNLENQMVKLTENQLMFHSLVQVAAKQFSIMRYIIREGK